MQCQKRVLGTQEPLPTDFDTERYLARNPDLVEAGVDPCEHYLTHGRIEGREY